MAEYTKTTGADGVAKFELEYGDYTVTVSYDDMTVTQDVAFRKNHKNFPIPIGKGTVTLTLKDSDDNLLNGAYAICCVNDYVDLENPNQDDIIGMGETDSDGVCTLKEVQDLAPTEIDAEIVFGTYYLSAVKFEENNILLTNMMLTVNQSEVETTVILEPMPFATLNIRVLDAIEDYDNPTPVTEGMISIDGVNDYTIESEVTTIENIPFGSYNLLITNNNFNTMRYKIKVSNEIENINLKLIDNTVTVTVTDENGNPLTNDGWYVYCSNGNFNIDTNTQTNENSVARFVDNSVPITNADIVLETFYIDGYEDYNGTFHLEDLNRNFTIQLTPQSTDGSQTEPLVEAYNP